MEHLEPTSYRFDRFTLDMRLGCMRVGNTVLPLRPKAFDVLLHLVRNPERLVTKRELMERVWPDVAVTENSLVQCIKEIREMLGDEQQTMIETVAKRGYRFLPAVAEIDAAHLRAGAARPPQTPLPAPDLPPPAAPPGGHSPRLALDAPPGRSSRKAAAVAAVAAAVAATGGVWWALGPRSARLQAPPPGRPDKSVSVAVLPLDPEAGGPDETLSRGIGEDVAAALGRFPDVAVASPKLVSRLVAAGTSTEDLARQLRVRYLVEGGLRRSADRIRITVRLTDLPQGLLLWSQTYDEPADAILALEEEITVRIAGALAVKLTSIEQKRIARRPAHSMEAYDYVLRGRELLTRLSRTSHSEARTMFERAIALAPDDPAAYVGLGRLDLSAVALGWTPDPAEALKRAEGLARKAIALDESNPSAHVLLGRVYTRTGDHARAVDLLRRAVALNPSDPNTHAGLGDALVWHGDTAGAIRALETASEIDPRLSGEDLFSLAAAHFIAGSTAEAIRVLERITTRNEGNAFVYALLAAACAESRRDDEARAAAAEVRRLSPFFDRALFGSLFERPEHRQRIAAALDKAGL